MLIGMYSDAREHERECKKARKPAGFVVHAGS
ncbi:MAG: hypothetical protein GX535_06620 [Xanthomonadaceae bacterium]|nr:hypothetical protein [Xanthomonadaceae bacterium]